MAPVWSLEREVGLAVELNLFTRNVIVFVHFVLHCEWVEVEIELQAKVNITSSENSLLIKPPYDYPCNNFYTYKSSQLVFFYGGSSLPPQTLQLCGQFGNIYPGAD